MITTKNVFKKSNNNQLLIITNLTIISLLYFGFLTHFILREIHGTNQIYVLRHIMMIVTGILVFVALHAFPGSTSRSETATSLQTNILTRFASVLFAMSLALCATISFSFEIAFPLFPWVNQGWLLGFAGAMVLLLALRSPIPLATMPILSIGALALGFIVTEGLHQGLITVGTVAWNAITDFDFAVLVPIVLLYFLIELIIVQNPVNEKKNYGILINIIRETLAAVTVFTLAMGIELKSTVIAGSSVVLIVALLYTLAPILRPRRAKPSSRWNSFFRCGVAWCTVASTMAIVLRGFGHLGETAAIGTFCLALVGFSLRWTTPRDLFIILVTATRSMLVLGLAFIVAALWNLFANHHADLGALFQFLDIPNGAIFPAGVLLLGLVYWLNPLVIVVLATPILYLGLEQSALAPVWTVPVIAILMSMTRCFRFRFRSNRIMGGTGSGLLVVVIVSAFASEPLVGYDLLLRSAPSSITGAESKMLALADGRILSVDELEANRWIPVRTFGRAPLRPDHGGSAFDRKRRNILLFGADTHFRDWNNSVTAFDLESQTWIRHYRPSPRYAMRADASGIRITGIIRVLPWPMHTYDGVVYHREMDALVVAAAPLHSLKSVPNGRFDPTWIYDLKTRRWRMGPITGETLPRFFGGTAIYDDRRNSIFYFNTVAAKFAHLPIGKERRYFRPELFELVNGLGEWRKVSHAPLGGMARFNAEFDSQRDEILLVTGNALDTRIGVYAHGGPGQVQGTWLIREIPSEGCDMGAPYAVAYDDEGRFLMLPDQGRGKGNLTCVYDVERNIVVAVKSALLPRLGMGFNLHHDSASRSFVLVSGNSLHGGRASVRYIRLDQSKF